MGNCISKISKGPFLVYEGLMKNDILFSKGIAGRALEMSTRGRTYMETHVLLRFSEIMTLASLQTGVW